MGRLEKVIELYGEIATTQPKVFTSLHYGYYRRTPKKIIKKGVPVKTIRQLSKWDPSGNNKYLDWILNRKLNTEVQIKTLKDFVDCFHQTPHKFKYRDIYKYQTKEDIVAELAELPNKLSKSEIKEYGAILVAETDQYKIIIPKTHMAAKMYGSGTKWCLTSASPATFNSYMESEITYFCIIKDPAIIKLYYGDKLDKNITSRYHKLAISFEKHSNNYRLWNAKDIQLVGIIDLLRIYAIDFYTICRDHYSRYKIQTILSSRVQDIKQQCIKELQHKKLPTYHDTIGMFDKISNNLEES